MKTLLKTSTALVIALTIIFSANSFADSDDKHKLVIQVSTDDARTQKIALNNAVNLQKFYGMDNIDIEIVAYGPGLGLLTKKSKQAKRITSLALQDITFSACGNTMKKVSEKNRQNASTARRRRAGSSWRSAYYRIAGRGIRLHSSLRACRT